jgi:hypothetical protein
MALKWQPWASAFADQPGDAALSRQLDQPVQDELLGRAGEHAAAHQPTVDAQRRALLEHDQR